MGSENSSRDDTGRSAPKLPVFLRVFFATFFFCIAVSVLVSYAMPVRYVGVARVVIVPGSATDSTNAWPGRLTELVSSDEVLNQALQRLQERPGRRPYTTLDELRGGIRVVDGQVNAGISIEASASRPADAADIANAVADALVRGLSTRPDEFEKADARVENRAELPWRPTSPNKPRNMGWGALTGILLGALAGGAVVQLRRRIERNAFDSERRDGTAASP